MPESRKPPLPAKLVDWLFAWLEAAYGRLWASQFVRADQLSAHKATWADMLAGLSEKHIRRGLDRIRDEAPRMPPNAVEFRRLCLGLPDRDSTIRRVRELRLGRDPVAHEIHKRIPTWTRRHGTYDDLERAAHEHYTNAVAAIEHEELEALPAPIDAA